jgi:hypothetical protein
MSYELGSLDDVLSDDELVSALADRRLDELHGGDGLAATLAAWCEDLDTEPSAASIPTADLADAAARRRTLRRTGRSLAAAAAVAVVCMGGLGVSRLAMSRSHDQPKAVDTAAATASSQARAQIWQQLGEARTALMQKRWAAAQQLVDSARAQLPQVSLADGRAALSSWIALLDKAVKSHASLSSDVAPNQVDNHEVAPRQLYNGGVPLPPGVNGATTAPTQVKSSLPVLPTTLPSLRPSQQPVGEPSSQAPTTLPPGSHPVPTIKPTHGPTTRPTPSQPPASSPSHSAPPTTDPIPTLPLGPNSTAVPPRLLPLPSLGPTPSATPTETPTPSAE